MTDNIWADPTQFLRNPPEVAAALRQLGLPRVDHYLAALSDRGGVDLTELRRLSENTPLALVGEDHLKLRRILAPFFSRSGLAPWKPVIKAGVTASLDRLEQANSPDLVKDFTNPLFLHVLPQMLGLRVHEPGAFFESVETIQRLTEPYLSVPALKALNRKVAFLVQSFAPREAANDQAGAAPESLLSLLERRKGELPEGMDPRYIVLGLLAGSNSATQSLAFALYGLLSGPGEAWREAAHPGWAEQELQHVLGLYQSTRTLVRVATAETEVAGCPYHAGQTAVADIIGANSCLRTESGDRSAHMSFGAGAHKCPGLFLSEMIFEAAIPALARRFPQMVLMPEKCRFVTTPMMQTPVALPCEIAPASRRVTARLCDIREMAQARRVMGEDENFIPPQMAEHLEQLAKQGELDLATAIKIARNAMFFMNGPRHSSLRDAVARQFTQGKLALWESTIDLAIASCLDTLAGMERPDLVAGFADPLRQRAVAPILGVAPTDPSRFEAIAPGLQDILEPWLARRELLRIQGVFAEAQNLMRPPQDEAGRPSLLGALLANPPKGFEPSDLMAAVLVFYGASYNLTHTLANALHRILTLQPEERQDVARPGWIEPRLEGIIALNSGPKYIYRVSRQDLDLAGLAVKAGDTLRLAVHALNRNTHAGAGHVSFGHGLHRCIGAGLSRQVLRRAIPALFARFPDLSLVTQGQSYFPMSQTVALRTLPCTLSNGPR